MSSSTPGTPSGPGRSAPAAASPRQLAMLRPHLRYLPPRDGIVLPPGYAIRTYQPGDEQAWAEIMNTGIGSGWTVERVREKLTGLPQFDPQGLFFITYKGQPVATACAWREHPKEREHGILHMVCALPQHRGHRFGYVVSLRVLWYFAEHGFTDCRLLTDDWRLSAIKTYLDLGFQPVYFDDRHRQRWRAVGEKLGRVLE
jgi:mycothiol synthase